MGFIYLTSDSLSEQLGSAKNSAKVRLPTVAATIIFEVKPQTIGRVLGIGLRVAGRIAGQHMTASAHSAAGAPPRRPITIDADQTRSAGRVAGKAGRGVAKG